MTSSNESWVIEKVAEFQNALLCRFGEEKAIHLSLRNLLNLKQSENNKLQLQICALQRQKQDILDKFIVKQFVLDIFQRVIRKAESRATYAKII